MTHMEKVVYEGEVDPGVAKGEKTMDELVSELGLDKRPARPVGVEQPETSPDHGPVRRMPEEHMIPLQKAGEKLEKKE